MRSSRFLALAAALAVATLWLARSTRGQAGAPIATLIWGGTVVTMDANGRVLPAGAVAIDGDRIVEVGNADDLLAKYAAETRVDVRGQIVLPGLVNTHTHAPMVLFRGLADDLALMDWLQKYIFPAEAKLVSPDFVRVGTRLAALEMIQSGTTTFADMYYFEDDIAQAAQEAGLRGVLGQSVIRFPVPDAPTPAEALARAESFIAKWKSDPLITPAVAPHSPYTLEGATLQAARELANKHGVPLLIHLAETRDEVRIVRDGHGRSPAMYLDGLGVWNGRSLAAHGVWLEDADLKMLAQKRVGVAHNPESNMKLASGIAAVPKWLRAGVLAGLGTDGAASNNDLDMFEAMRVAAFLHKVATGNPQAMPAQTALELATRRGAEALGLADRIGSLEAGKQADVITVSVAGARQTPMFDPISHLVYVSRGDDVTNTIVAGRWLMRDRQVQSLKPADVLRDARTMAARVSEAVGAPA
ncbi:MAG TPA: amidohydrolase, partial [Vicinamibacterales bacterium]|nr:amidohydrolase [Vicinamibacterales bacterium]